MELGLDINDGSYMGLGQIGLIISLIMSVYFTYKFMLRKTIIMFKFINVME